MTSACCDVDYDPEMQLMAARAEIRRLRAMVLRAHTEFFLCRHNWSVAQARRAARLLRHYADGIDSGRIA